MCLNMANLCDLSFRGYHYTWWNKQEANPITKKLDRIFVNDNWLLTFLLSFGEFKDPEFSDHCPSCVSLGIHQQGKRKPFKFANFLLHNKDFLGLVAEAWENMHIQGTSMFFLKGQ